MNYLNNLPSLLLITTCLFWVSCADDDTSLPTLGVAFETTAIGISSGSTNTEVTVSLSRATAVESIIDVSLTETGVTYGTDYSTEPPASGLILQLTVPAGSESVSFTVNRLVDFIAPESNVTFNLDRIDGETASEISGNTAITVSFEAITSPGSNLTASIGGPTEPNQVYIDFSLNSQSAVERTSWDLGFYTGELDKVILNYSTYAMVQAVDKTDITSVTAQDTLGFASQMVIGMAGAHVYIDNPDGDLDKLAIADISPEDTENSVYIINRGGGPGTEAVDPGSVDVGSTPRGWKKIRILKDGDNYVIQHADIGSTTFSQSTLAKDTDTNFVYFSFDDGQVEVEPLKERWDIVFTVSSNILNFGAGDGAYGFSDYVLSNRQGGAQVAFVGPVRDGFGAVVDPGPGVLYDDFTTEDLNADYLQFSEAGNVIGSTWRSVFSGTAYSDVFFVVRDPDGNHYKVQFLGLLDDQGNRGNSSLKYELL